MTAVSVERVNKSFVLHQQGGVRIPVLRDVSLKVARGECVALAGASGAGKSTLVRLIYGNYRADSGRIMADGTDIAAAPPRQIMQMRRQTVSHVSQFLRVLPRVPTIRLVAEPLERSGVAEKEARERAGALLERLRIPRKLWPLSPFTFSGGEQQRVNIARGFIRHYPIILLDEPTASLDETNRQTVMELIREAKQAGAAVVGIFHDRAQRAGVADREVDMSRFSAA